MEKDIVDYLNEKVSIEKQIIELNAKQRNIPENVILVEISRRLIAVNKWIDEYNNEIPKVNI